MLRGTTPNSLAPCGTSLIGYRLIADTLALSRALPSQPKAVRSWCAAPRPCSAVSALAPFQQPGLSVKAFNAYSSFRSLYVMVHIQLWGRYESSIPKSGT